MEEDLDAKGLEYRSMTPITKLIYKVVKDKIAVQQNL